MNPDGYVREVIFSVVNEQTLRALVKEWKATGSAYQRQVQTVMRNTYRAHYRQMVPHILEALVFHSNNRSHRPVMDAVAVVAAYARSKSAYYPLDIDVPFAGVVRAPRDGSPPR